jgi:chromosome segregation ATPase
MASEQPTQLHNTTSEPPQPTNYQSNPALAALQGAYVALKRQVDALRAEEQHKGEHLRHLSDELVRVRTDLERLQADVQRAHEMRSHLLTECVNFTKHLDAMKDEAARLASVILEAHERKVEIARITLSIQQESERLQVLQAQQRIVSQNLNDAEARLKGRQTELEQLNTLISQRAVEEQRAREIIEQASQLGSKLQSLTADLARLQAELTSHTQAIEACLL